MTRKRRIPPVARTVSDLALPVGQRLLGGFRSLLGHFSNRIAALVFLPGVLALMSLRGVAGRLLGIPVSHADLLEVFGGRLEIAGDRRLHWQRASVLLLPHLCLVAIGAALLTSSVVQFVALGVSPLPVVTASPEVLASKDLGWPIAHSALLTYGPLDLVRLWTGLACWFCAAPGYDSVKTARQELAQAVVHQPRAAHLARAGRLITAPFAWVAAVLGVFDNAATWLGGNVLIASGGITLLALFVIELRIVALLT